MFVRSCRLTHLIVDISAEIQRNVSLLELTLVTFFDGLPHLAEIFVGFGLVLDRVVLDENTIVLDHLLIELLFDLSLLHSPLHHLNWVDHRQ